MNKTQLVRWIANNCTCWKGQEKLLTTLSETNLSQIKTTIENSKRWNVVIKNAKGKVKVGNEGEENTDIDIASLADFFGISIDPANDPVNFIKALIEKLDKTKEKLAGQTPTPPTPPTTPEVENQEENQVEEETVANEEVPPTEETAMENECTDEQHIKPVTNKKLTAKQWLQSAPIEIRTAVVNAMNLEKQEKTKIVNKLTSNLKGETKTSAVSFLNNKSLNELKSIEVIANKQTTVVKKEEQPLYIGNAGIDSTEFSEEEPLNLPQMQWDN